MGMEAGPPKRAGPRASTFALAGRVEARLCLVRVFSVLTNTALPLTIQVSRSELP